MKEIWRENAERFHLNQLLVDLDQLFGSFGAILGQIQCNFAVSNLESGTVL